MKGAAAVGGAGKGFFIHFCIFVIREKRNFYGYFYGSSVPVAVMLISFVLAVICLNCGMMLCRLLPDGASRRASEQKNGVMDTLYPRHTALEGSSLLCACLMFSQSAILKWT